jgi:hypothetical protein
MLCTHSILKMEETLSFEAYMLTIYEQTWNRIVVTIFAEPVRLFNSQPSYSESIDALHSWDTHPADSTTTATNDHLTSFKCTAHYRSKDISEPSLMIDPAGVVWLVYCYICGREWFACLSQSLLLLFWKPVQTLFVVILQHSLSRVMRFHERCSWHYHPVRGNSVKPSLANRSY